MTNDVSSRPPSRRPEIRVESIRPLKSSLICSITYDTKLEAHFNSSVFYFNYDFDVEKTPAGILAIPVLGVLAPLGWVTGATVVAKEVDSEYVSSLEKVARIMKETYPTANISSALDCIGVDTPWPKDEGRRCLLYSGGVDSTTSLLRNLGPDLSLMSVRGTPDLRLWEGEFWERVHPKLSSFVRSLGVEMHVVETNAMDVVNFEELNRVLEDSFSSGWWENLSHGLILLSLCAPYTYEHGISKMMIASSYSQSLQRPWGSSPASDQAVAWGGLTTLHDSFDLRRMEKISGVLVPYMAGHPGAVQLRVCTGERDARLASGTLNCGDCRKCVRTEMVLVWAGVDPAECGFPAPDFAEIKRGLISGRLRGTEAYSLRAIHAERKPLKPDLVARYPEIDGFFNWFYGWEIPDRTKKGGVFRRLAPEGSRRRRVIEAIR